MFEAVAPVEAREPEVEGMGDITVLLAPLYVPALVAPATSLDTIWFTIHCG